MNWTQPCCPHCWADRNPDREPVTVNEREVEQCCICGSSTASGIYVRVDPRTVAYPAGGDE